MDNIYPLSFNKIFKKKVFAVRFLWNNNFQLARETERRMRAQRDSSYGKKKNEKIRQESKIENPPSKIKIVILIDMFCLILTIDLDFSMCAIVQVTSSLVINSINLIYFFSSFFVSCHAVEFLVLYNKFLEFFFLLFFMRKNFFFPHI